MKVYFKNDKKPICIETVPSPVEKGGGGGVTTSEKKQGSG
jgi:hypothetical protein